MGEFLKNFAIAYTLSFLLNKNQFEILLISGYGKDA